MDNHEERIIGEMLKRGLLTMEMLQTCIVTQQGQKEIQNKKFSEILVEKHLVGEEDITSIKKDLGLSEEVPTSRQEGTREREFLDSSISAKIRQKYREVFPQSQIDEFEHYTILEEIGRGSMGIVYKAMQKQENKVYALKVLPKRVINDPLAVHRFFQEICVHKNLSHPNIIQLHKIGMYQQTVFIVMEYVLGNDLDTLVRKQGKFSEHQALQMIIPLARALEYTHSMEIVHRDLKPANILIEEGSRIPKIADFGLAKISSQQPKQDFAFGTPAYMAPEQVSSSQNVDIRADIYSLGSILYYALSGKRPYFEIQDPFLLIQIKSKRNAEAIANLVPDIHRDIRGLVAKAMERALNQRHQTPTEFIEQAQIALEKIENQRRPGSRKTPRPSEQLKEEARHKSIAFTPKPEKPQEDVNELFMTATRYEMEPVLATFSQEVSEFIASPVGSLLRDEGKTQTKLDQKTETEAEPVLQLPADNAASDEVQPFEEQAFEETLLTITMISEAALRLPEFLKQLLLKAKPKNFFNEVLLLLKSEEISGEYRRILKELRYLLLLRGNSLTKRESLLEIINKGTEYLDLKLDEMSRVTQYPDINRHIREYFNELVASYLKTYDQRFRKELLACKDSDEMSCYLENYPLKSLSILKRYKNLHIIKKTKQIQKALQQNPEKIEKILDEFLENYERELRKLFTQHHIQKDSENTFWRMAFRSQDLATYMKHLMRLQAKPEFKSMSTRIANLIEVFLDMGGRTSLEDLKTSLNFIPAYQRSKICQLVCQKLYEELTEKIKKLLVMSPETGEQFKNFMTLLQNPRYDHAGIKLYGYPTKILATKIMQLKNSKDTMSNIFSGNPLPQEILALIYEDREMEVSARSLTLQNCLRQLQRLKRQYNLNPHLPLLKPLLSIFHSYAKINFADESSMYAISGYDISRIIVQFYNDTDSPIQLPPELRKEIAEILTKLMERPDAIVE